MNGKNHKSRGAGFTLIELLVVMAIIGALMSLVTPGYFKQNTRAKETVLRHNLFTMRGSIDDYRADHATNPASLEVLVTERYLKEIPQDPITGRRDSWLPQSGEIAGVADVKSGAKGNALDGTSYAGW
ncbi:type II secretion system protein [Paraherbaspirillum soli]|uniref:Type II secretion system protein n=1 Tax=Paraherbaspirillum soli TaxID=631222 RepID=A0ABW0MFG8_9BURK